MSKRLQVLLPEKEFAQIKAVAARRHLTVAEWVRQSLRRAYLNEPSTDKDRKMAAVRKAVVNEFPTGDVEQMNAEIQRGYVAQ